MNREKIIEISKFRGINEISCKSCGVVSAVERVEMEFNGPKVRANCPDCGSYLRFLPTVKAWRIFKNKKVGLIEIEKVETSYLTWYLKTIPKIPADLRNNIEQLIERRTTDPAAFVGPPPDLDTREIMEAVERREYLRAELVKTETTRRDLVRNFDPSFSALDAKKQIGQIEYYNKLLKEYQRELKKVLNKISELEKV